MDVAKHDPAALPDLEERYRTLFDSHERLRRSEEHLRLATEAADIVTWQMDVATGVYVASPNYTAVFGNVEDGRPNEAMAAIATLVHPDDAAGLVEAVQKTARGDGDLRYECRLVPPISKDVLWVEIFGTLIGGDEEGPSRVVGIARNVTARKRNEAAIKEAADRDAYRIRLADVLRQLTDPVRIQAEAMRALRLHLRATRAHYVEVEGDDAVVYVDETKGILPVVARHRMADYGADLISRFRRGESTVISDIRTIGLGEAELARHAAVGARSRVSIPLMRGGRLTAAVDVFHAAPHEWTVPELAVIAETAQRTWAALEQARAEAALRESEARKRLAMDAAAMGSFIWFPEKDRAEPDAQLLALLGLGPTATISLAAAMNTLIHPADRERFHAALARSLDPSVQAELNEEIRVTHPDGAVRWLAVTGRLTFAGEPLKAMRMVGVATDVTERKGNETRLREADQRKDEFLAMLAHELRNPLTPIRTGLELIRLAGDTPGGVERVRSMMQRQLAHMTRLIDDLLDVSRITSGKIRLQREPTPLDSLVNGALEANRAAINAKSLALSVDLPETLCVLDVDPTRFVQVLSNVLHNAAKFTESGGHIRVSAQLTGAAVAGRGQLAISVKDSGIGMPAELLPRVFDLFTQEDRGSSQPGLGLGLALARRLVEMHDGQIDARSDGPGRGSEFVIRIPLSAAGREPDRAENVSAPGLNRRVLVIDDNEDAANATAMLVEELGGTSRVAYSGDEGIREALAHHPDIVLLDIQMPGLDGYDTCRRIRDALGDEVFLVALTGFGREEDKEQAARAGFDAHLTKPAELSLLAMLLTSERSTGGPAEARHPRD